MNYNQVHAALILRGSNFNKWARENGFNRRTVSQAAKRWAGSTKQPRGILTFTILQKLSIYIEQEIFAGALTTQLTEKTSA